MDRVDTSSRKEQVRFGLVMAGAFCGLALVRWWLKGAPPVVLFAIAAAFLVTGLVFPRALRPVFVAWMKLAEGVNWVVTRLLLTLVFVLFFIPGRLIMQARGKDPLNRGFFPEADTYWEEAETQPDDLEKYLNQY